MKVFAGSSGFKGWGRDKSNYFQHLNSISHRIMISQLQDHFLISKVQFSIEG